MEDGADLAGIRELSRQALHQRIYDESDTDEEGWRAGL